MKELIPIQTFSELKFANTIATKQEGRIAIVLIEKWGMIMALPDGEDSSGRRVHKLMPPEGVVDRAFKTAKLAMERLRSEGLIEEITEDQFENLVKKSEGKELL